MGQYIKVEIKRLFHTLPGFLLSLFSILLLCLFTVLLAERILPEALEVKPFRAGLCVEGSDMMSDYVREYVQQMESTENLIEFCEMERSEMEKALQEEELTAGIIIPERTAESIMDGTNIPIRVLIGAGADTTERYLQTELLSALTECGAALIDVPQAETLLLYEMQVENPAELGRTLDLFHAGLVIGRESWFKKETASAFGSMDMRTYYLASGAALLFLFWGLGSGSFFREQEKNLPVLLERRGICLFAQQGIRQILFFLLYLLPVPVLFWACEAGRAAESMLPGKADIYEAAELILSGRADIYGAAVPALLCAAMLAMQCSFFFQLAPTTGSGIVVSGIWSLAGFFGAGGILPAVFLPKSVTGICEILPAGICMELFQRIVTGSGGTGWQMTKCSILWCLFFGTGGQLIFHWRQRGKKKK